MPTIPAVQRQAELSSREEFLALLCADEELLRAEFEEIIAAEWPTRHQTPQVVTIPPSAHRAVYGDESQPSWPAADPATTPRRGRMGTGTLTPAGPNRQHRRAGRQVMCTRESSSPGDALAWPARSTSSA
jgi:hypothetical protein